MGGSKYNMCGKKILDSSGRGLIQVYSQWPGDEADESRFVQFRFQGTLPVVSSPHVCPAMHIIMAIKKGLI